MWLLKKEKIRGYKTIHNFTKKIEDKTNDNNNNNNNSNNNNNNDDDNNNDDNNSNNNNNNNNNNSSINDNINDIKSYNNKKTKTKKLEGPNQR